MTKYLKITVSVLSGFFFTQCSQLSNMKGEVLSGPEQIPPAYLTVFDIEPTDIQNSSTYVYKNRPAISNFTYLDKHIVTILSFELQEDLSLDEIVEVEEDKDILIDPGIIYAGTGGTMVTTNFVISKDVEKVEKIIIGSMSANKIIHSSDSMLNLYLQQSKGFRLKYNTSSFYDIVVKVHKNYLMEFNGILDIELRLLKYKQKLYLMFFYEKLDTL